MIQKTAGFVLKSRGEIQGTFEGYASVFGNIDSDGEVIDKGAFSSSLKEHRGVVPILWQHDRAQPIGWNEYAEEDGYGLKVRGALLIDTELGRQAWEFLSQGLKSGGRPGLSIGFSVPPGGEYTKNGRRHFREVALREYSIVTFPANEAASVRDVKSFSFQPTLADVERSRAEVLARARRKQELWRDVQAAVSEFRLRVL